MNFVKRLLLMTVLLAGAIFVMLVVTARVPVAQSVLTATENGDINGDNIIDISDAISLLTFLFQGGAPPVAVAGSSPLVEAKISSIDVRVATISDQLNDNNARLNDLLAAVENLAVLSETGLERQCEGRPDRFNDNGDGTVTDICSGLMWQQVTADPDGLRITVDDMIWPEAAALVDDIGLAGHTDWRLPTVGELSNLIPSDAIASEPAAYPIFGVLSAEYWTSTSSGATSQRKWVVDFTRDTITGTGGSRRIVETSSTAFVLAVRQP